MEGHEGALERRRRGRRWLAIRRELVSVLMLNPELRKELSQQLGLAVSAHLPFWDQR